MKEWSYYTDGDFIVCCYSCGKTVSGRKFIFKHLSFKYFCRECFKEEAEKLKIDLTKEYL